ncbi:MAG: glycine cleavage system protein GcvH [Thermotogaceae bacterium]|nr:glycine cleavage system protein GcvH [Thermotogaceae bacterium]
MKKYSKTHEWVEIIEENKAKIGISNHAQDELGDVVYIELPEIGSELKKGEAFSTVESVKAAEDIYAPVSGKVTAVNEELNDHPELINEDAEGKGWICEVELSDPSELDDLMTEEEYKKFIEG